MFCMVLLFFFFDLTLKRELEKKECLRISCGVLFNSQ